MKGRRSLSLNSSETEETCRRDLPAWTKEADQDTQPVPSKYTEKGNLRALPPNSETLKKIAADRKDHEEHPEWKSMYRVIHGRDGREHMYWTRPRRTSTFQDDLRQRKSRRIITNSSEHLLCIVKYVVYS
uniref:Uncharacterized protein n=1 Tax=Ditylenchus dipsaci TaxID=166011 RepID=A0A915EEF7_9BILA